jgi:large subunit ribosomal protein L3
MRKHKPVSGSRGFWPKGRAARIYATLKCKKYEEKAIPLGFAGYKAGMTRVLMVDTKKGSPTYGQDVVKAVTVIETPPLAVIGIRGYGDGLYGPVSVTTVWAKNLEKNLSRKTRIPKKIDTEAGLAKIENDINNGKIKDIRIVVCTRPAEIGAKKRPELFEIPLGGQLKEKLQFAKSKLGDVLKIENVFEEGEFVDVISVTKGKGRQGPVKRFGVKIRPRKHQKRRRHGGVLGGRKPAKVLPVVVPRPGQLGFQTRTEWNKHLIKIGKGGLVPNGGFLKYGFVKDNYILLEGSVPGPKKRLIMIRKGYRAEQKRPVEIKSIALESQQ